MENNCFFRIFKYLSIFICILWFLRMITENNYELNFRTKSFARSPICKDIILQQSIFKGNEMISEIEFEYNYDYKKLLECFNLDEKHFFHMPFVSYISQKKWIFQGFADHIFTSNDSILNPDAVKCGDIVYIKTDYLENFIKIYHKQIRNPYMLMTQESDFKIGYPWHLDLLNDPKIIKWFAINVIAKHPKLVPIPVGMAPPIGQDFSVLYNMSKTLKPFHERSTLLYVKFTPYIESRSKVLEYIKQNLNNKTNVVINEEKIEWPIYLSNFGNAKFVLSPPGNGIDPHRTWEALSMGAVPIVLNQSEFQSLFDDMPVMVVNDWTEVTEKKMEKFIREKLINNLSKDGIPWRPRLWLRYWITKIMNEKNNSIQQFCKI